MADRATGPPGGESSRQRAGYYTLRVLSLPTEPLAIQPKEPLYLGLSSLSEGPDDEMSGISFDLNKLLYARLDSEITARAITKSAFTKDSVQISVLSFSNLRKGSSTLERTNKLFKSFNKLRIDKKDIKSIRIAKSVLKAILTITDEERTEEISKKIEDTDTERDLGFGNEPLKDFKRRRTTGNYIGNLLPIRLLAKHGTYAYGTLSAFDDNKDDFLELRAADLYLRAKELALFARSFFKELNRYGLTSDDYLAAFLIMLTKEAITFYYNHVIKARLSTFKANAIALAKELKGIQGSLRPGLKDDRSLANKLYSACKNVLKTTIARMNLAFTFTAVIADIRKAIAFATKTFRLLAKTRAYASFNELHDHTCSYNTLKADSDLDEKYECFIQDRQYFGSKKATKAIKGEKRCFVCKKPSC
ncbi:hypothetical protein MBM_09658 [Drepanopeziza brunnea f. sp. 'multigermtubi' MB_m1]|uniref:Uncharacterized protein n=1 Tax=Marssonina brunnea f. sp. multigermtubi (strain MB_m1) TaxID=1072389 RepID=K1XIB6_MARBU|nr:uncharacterized protein MBM_09658 [Drepanopeziza brunnea f. sp. 'multigermtubi' MB_m1]EKD12159.1 hypothetical protein MBM_09658 [Drepanopeziza brunnea f. sp. 'multigermtubi' MB_m1]